MKHLTAILISAALLCMLCGCAKTNTDGESHAETAPSGATMEVTMSHSFRWERFLPEEDLDICYFYPFGEQTLIYSPKIDGTHVFGIWSPMTGDFVRREYKKESDFTELSGVYDMGDTIQVLMRHVVNEPLSTSYLRHTFDVHMNEVAVEDVTSLYQPECWIQSSAMDAQGNRFHSVVGEGILCEMLDGTLSPVDGTQGSEKLYTGRDGFVYAILDRRTLKRLHPDTLTAEEIPLKLPKIGGNYAEILQGNAAYDVLCYTDEFLYGINLTDGGTTEILNWQESDVLPSMDRRNLLLLPDGRALFCVYGHSEQLCSYLLTARTQDEVDSMKLISMADMVSSGSEDWLSRMVSQYNRQSEDSRIVTKSYYDSDAPDFGTEELKKDLLDGVIPDILASNPDYHMFSNKGLFEDLSVWMENDPEFNKEEYVMNFLDSLRYNGRLERMGFRFAVNTYAAKTEHLGDAQRLTLLDYVNLELPEGMELMDGVERTRMFNALMYSQLMEFVDYQAGTCCFDSETFISLLDWFGSFPEQTAIQDDYAFRENRALLYPLPIHSLKSYHATGQVVFGNADVTLTGMPIGTEGNGGVFAPLGLITVSSSSQYKEEIWEFIKFCLREENQLSDDFGFPVNRNALSSAMERDQQPPTEMNKFTYSYGDLSEEVTAATAEEAAELTAYIDGITVCGIPDDFIYNIVEEETARYFAGDCTAEDAARIIQSRVSLYLAEQYHYFGN